MKRQIETTTANNEILAAIRISGQALLGTQELPEILQLILEQLSRVVDFDSASIMLVRDNKLEIVAQSGFRFQSQHFSYEQLKKLQHVQKVIKSKNPEIISDTVKDDRWYTLPDSEYIRSWLGAPLVVKGNSIGVLNIDKEQPNFYTQQHADMVVTFADQVAIAIETARLFQETQQRADALEATTDHLNRLVTSSFDGIITIDIDGIIIDFNAKAEEILGCKASEMISKSVQDDVYADRLEAKRIGYLLDQAVDGKLVNYETYVKSKQGDLIPILLSATWLFDVEGNKIGSVGYFKDIRSIQRTERHRQKLLDAIYVVAQSEDQDDGLHNLAKIMVESLIASFCYILLADSSGENLIAKAAYPYPRHRKLAWDPQLGKICRPFGTEEASEPLKKLLPSILRTGKKRQDEMIRHIEKEVGLQSELHSVLIIPITVGERKLGYCILGEMRSWERSPIDDEKIEFARSLTAQVAVLIEKAQLFDEASLRARNLETLQKMAININSSFDLGEILKQTCQAAVDFFKVDHCGLVRFDPDKVQGEVVAEYPAEMKTLGMQMKLKGISLEEEILTKKKPIVVYDIESEENLGELRNLLHGEFGIQSSLYAPIIVDGEVIGTFGVDSTEKKRDFTPDIENGKLFAAHVAVAIDKADSFRRVQQDAALTKAMVKVSHILTGTYNLNDQMKIVWEFVSEHLSSPMFYVGIYHKLKDELDFIAAYEMNKPVDIPPTSLIKEDDWGLTGFVVKTGQSLEWATKKQLDDFVKDKEIKVRQLGALAQSSLIIPLDVESNVVGVIAIQSNEPHMWNENEKRVFRTLAELVAGAVRNAQLYQEKIAGEMLFKAAFEANEDIISALGPEKTLEAIVKRIREVMGAMRASVILVDEMGNPKYLVSDGYDQNIKLATSLRQNGVSMRVMRTGKGRYIDNLLTAKGEVHPKMIEQNVKAAACLPLAKDGINIGVLWVHYANVRYFTEADKEALALFSTQAAIAYGNALQMNEVEQMRELAEALVKPSNSNEVLEVILRKAKDVLKADSTSIWIYDEDHERFVVESSVQIGIPYKIWKEFKEYEPRKNGMTYSVMKKGWIGVPNIKTTDEPLFGERTRIILSRLGIESFQAISLTTGSEKFGVLYVNYNSPRWFSQEEKKVAFTFANYATVALKKARLIEDINKAYDTARVVAESTVSGDLQGTLSSLVSGTQNVLRSDAITLYTYNQDLNMFDFPPSMIGVEHPDKVVELDRVEKDSVPYRIIALDKLYVSENVPTDPLLKGKFTKRENIRSFVGIPLIANNRKIGVMCINYRRYHSFTRKELENIEFYSYQAAIAIQNAQSYEELKQTKGLVGAMTALAWMGMTSSTWRHTVGKHALTIQEQAELLRNDIHKVKLKTSKVEDRISMITRLSRKILETPQTLPLSSEDRTELLSVNNLIAERVQQLWNNSSYQKVKVKLDLKLADSAVILASREWMRRAFDILVDNAVEAVSGRSTQEITIGTEIENKRCNIFVSDTGPGIPENVQKRLMQKTIDPLEQSENVGMGLLMVQAIVQTYGGELKVGNVSPKGTTMIMVLPLGKWRK